MRIQFTTVDELIEACRETAHTARDRSRCAKKSGCDQESHDYGMKAETFRNIAEFSRGERNRLQAVADERREPSRSVA